MTVITTYQARCNRCLENFPIVTLNLGDLRADLDKAGWTTAGGMDICPACLPIVKGAKKPTRPKRAKTKKTRKAVKHG